MKETYKQKIERKLAEIYRKQWAINIEKQKLDKLYFLLKEDEELLLKVYEQEKDL